MKAIRKFYMEAYWYILPKVISCFTFKAFDVQWN